MTTRTFQHETLRRHRENLDQALRDAEGTDQAPQSLEWITVPLALAFAAFSVGCAVLVLQWLGVIL